MRVGGRSARPTLSPALALLLARPCLAGYSRRNGVKSDTEESRFEGGVGGHRSCVGLQMQIRCSRAQTETRGPTPGGRVVRNVLIIVYLVIGVFVAYSHHYFAHLTTLKPVLSAVLAVPLWPLVLFGVSLHLK